MSQHLGSVHEIGMQHMKADVTQMKNIECGVQNIRNKMYKATVWNDHYTAMPIKSGDSKISSNFTSSTFKV